MLLLVKNATLFKHLLISYHIGVLVTTPPYFLNLPYTYIV